MRIKKLAPVILAFAVIIGCLNMDAGAVNANILDESEHHTASATIRKASGRFSMSVPANTLVTASSSFPMSVGETIRINAVYTPDTTSVDFGFIAPDGLFYYVNTTDGSFDETIDVEQHGYYTLAVRNNSYSAVSVSGLVN